MKKIMMFLAVSAAALSGCVKENPASNANAAGNNGAGIRTIRVSAGDQSGAQAGDQSRMGVNINRPNPDTYYWQAGDKVILCGVSGDQFTGQNYTFELDAASANQATGTFTLAADELEAPAAGDYLAVHLGDEDDFTMPWAYASFIFYEIPAMLKQTNGPADVANYMLLAAPVTLADDGTIPDVTLEHKTAVVELGITTSDATLQGATLTGVSMTADAPEEQYAGEIDLAPTGAVRSGSGAERNTISVTVSDPNAKLDGTTPYYIRLVTLMGAAATGNVTFSFAAQSGPDNYLSHVTLPSIDLNTGSIRPAAIDLASHISLSGNIEIYTAADLDNIRHNVMNGAILGNYILMNDIDLSTYNGGVWTPIGDWNTPFTGSFDGNSHKITGLSVNITEDEYNATYADAGLFGGISGGSVSDLGVEISSIMYGGDDDAGGIAGYLDSGTITNCYTTGDITASSLNGWGTGGIVGMNYSGIISNCYSSGNIYSGGGDAGGIAGVNEYGTISNCYGTGNISSASGDAGGIAGYFLFGTITDCYSTGNISTSDAVSYCGGIAEYTNGDDTGGDVNTLTGCAAINPSVNAGSGYAGCIMGSVTDANLTGSSISNNLASAAISVTGDQTQANNGTATGPDAFLQQSTYETLGWAFGSTDSAPWKMGASGYPVFYWQ